MLLSFCLNLLNFHGDIVLPSLLSICHIFTMSNFQQTTLVIFLCYFFFQKTGFGIACKLSPIYMKYQCLVSGKNKKKNINLSSAALACRVVKVQLFKIA